VTNNKTTPGSFWQVIKSCSGTELDRRNQYRFAAWTLAWGITYVAASWALKSDRDLASPLTWGLAIGPALLSIVPVFAYMRFLRMADELLRKIQLDGLAMGFAAGVLLVAGYQLFEAAGAPALQTDDILLVMIFGWMLGQFVGMWRYR
jgi:hypothetical protein